MAKWELRAMDGYSVVMRTEGEVWVAMLADAPEKMKETELRERQVAVLKAAAELVEDANRGVESAEGEARIARALDGAEKELAGRSPAWVAANLVREAILILTMDRPKDMGESLYGRSLVALGEAMEQLQCLVRREREVGEVPAPDAHGFDAQAAAAHAAYAFESLRARMEPATADSEPEGNIG